ncbi:GNAT family N-acetyltransferase [Agromyces sp. MMS24-K17]|uniref:GNAT family N-acetyltransferase n=1 Tax=Agromyces sp. MMS24-K17 TaxID=3372850 RepID=UPI003754AA1E
MTRLATGAPGAVVFAADDPVLGPLELRVLDVDDPRDLDVLDDWVRRPWAGFWGLADHSREELREVYRFVDSLPTHHAFLLRRDGEPIVLLQTYEPEHDPVGERYDVEPGDAGIHFFLGGRGAPTAGLMTRVFVALGGFLFADPAVRRIVVEPDVGNDRAVALMTRLGFVPGPVIDLGHKRARLAFLDRERFEALAGRASTPAGATTP